MVHEWTLKEEGASAGGRVVGVRSSGRSRVEWRQDTVDRVWKQLAAKNRWRLYYSISPAFLALNEVLVRECLNGQKGLQEPRRHTQNSLPPLEGPL